MCGEEELQGKVDMVERKFQVLESCTRVAAEAECSLSVVLSQGEEQAEGKSLLEQHLDQGSRPCVHHGDCLTLAEM